MIFTNDKYPKSKNPDWLLLKTSVCKGVSIGAGSTILLGITIGKNAVIGADGLSTDRGDNGHALTMPQFGGVVIEDDVQIGALTVIARGAIDNTIIRRG